MSRVQLWCGNQGPYIDMIDFELVQLRVSVSEGSDDERDDVSKARKLDHLKANPFLCQQRCGTAGLR
jgi:hypothetical protein